jgi:hypothetical protein
MKKEEFLIPKKGVKVRDPKTYNILPEAGAMTSLTTYWRRRIKCGDVVIRKVEEKIIEPIKENKQKNNKEE